MCFRDCELVSQETPIHHQLPRVTRSGISDLMADVAHIGPLETQLQATLDKVPAYTWYAAPTGGLTFVNTLVARIVSDPRPRSGRPSTSSL